MVSAWDMVHRIPLGWSLLPYGSDERMGVKELLPNIDPSYIAVFNRGYPSKEFLRDMVLARR